MLALPLFACPFDEADTEVTIDAYKTISKAVKRGDFSQAHEEIVRQKVLYEYFGKDLYQRLLKGAVQKDPQTVQKMLDRSLVLEIRELLEKAEESFGAYKKARLLLVKAKKHLKVLTKEKEPHRLMKEMLRSLGNPGLMGMGKREPDKEAFVRAKKRLLEMLHV